MFNTNRHIASASKMSKHKFSLLYHMTVTKRDYIPRLTGSINPQKNFHAIPALCCRAAVEKSKTQLKAISPRPKGHDAYRLWPNKTAWFKQIGVIFFPDPAPDCFPVMNIITGIGDGQNGRFFFFCSTHNSGIYDVRREWAPLMKNVHQCTVVQI